MRRAKRNVLDIKAQLLIAVILVSATSTVSAQTADQTSPPTAAAATEIAVPKADAVKKADIRDIKKAHTASTTWRCGWGLFSWLQSCSSGRVGLVLGTAY